MHRLIFILFCLLPEIFTSYGNLYSQETVSVTERNFHLNVKQLGEFVSRFNYKTDFKGNSIDSVFISKVSREKYLELLFNNEDPRLNSDSDSKYSDLQQEFINEVISKNFIINRYSAGIIAEAKSQVIYKNKPTEISVFLNQEILNRGVKWVLLSVKADFLDVLKQDTILLRFIPPTSNETSFISLKRVFDDKHFQHYYSNSNYSYDPLSAFLFALNSNLVKFEYVNEIEYYILDIPGWCIRVKEFNRNTTNSGWLIDNISRLEIDIEEYIEDLIKE